MQIRLDPSLTETVTLQEITRRQEMGDLAPFREYHLAADPLYHCHPDTREAGFRRLHALFFERLGYAQGVQQAVHEFPEIEARASEVVVALAATSVEEGADLARERVNGNGRATTRVGIRLQADRFLDLSTLQRYLRHELCHVTDLLNPDFGYEGDTVEIIIRNRYRLLWCLSIDARLETAGREPLADKPMHWRQFDAQYGKFATAVRQAIFERLWRPEPVSHTSLLLMARSSEALLRLAGDAGQKGEGGPRPTLLPGSPCPLCRFPSYHFVEHRSLLDSTLTAAIQQDFPDWTSDKGLCARCLEAYALRTGRW
ncbi:MAG: hypothetical protein KGL32_02150 [candidate division NC10 bacterium]|nr:hypothetical protein [candidate division NC10 bacterium]